jgi:hypothetical protein
MLPSLRAAGARTALPHVAASAGTCTLAVRDGANIVVSFADGRPFAPALVGPGSVGALIALDDGAVVALRAPDLLGVARPGGSSAWRRLPASNGEASLVAAGSWIAMTVQGALALSDDQGATWTYAWLPESFGEGMAIHIADDGAVRIAIPKVTFEVGAQRTRLLLYRAQLPELRWRKLWTSSADAGSWAFGDGAWLYAYLGDDSERMQLVAVSPAGKMRALNKPSVPDAAVWPYSVAGNGRAVVADLANTLANLTGGKLVRPVCWGEQCVPDLGQSPWPSFGLLAVDRHGLPLVGKRDLRGVLVRLSKAGGERALFWSIHLR